LIIHYTLYIIHHKLYIINKIQKQIKNLNISKCRQITITERAEQNVQICEGRNKDTRKQEMIDAEKESGKMKRRWKRKRK
jgi:hypothetical protein